MWSLVAGIAIVALVAGIATYALRARTSTPAAQSNGASPTGSNDQAGLLAAAYQAGRIGRPTWLLYRAYSMFGVDALPQQYSQGAANTDDIELGEEITRGAPLPPKVRDAITGLIDRPTDPHSVFYGDGPITTAIAQPGHAELAAFADRCKLDPSAWWAMYSQKHMAPDVPGEAPHGAFKVWTKCTGDWQTRLTTVVNVIDSLWGPETSLMGAPLADNDPSEPDALSYGGDSAIDFYIVPRDTHTNRLGNGAKIAGIAAACAFSSAPYAGRKSSGYVLLDQARVSNADFRAEVAHELFHVLEYAHAHRAASDIVNGVVESNWYTEASAVWAMYYFARDVANYRWAKGFQISAAAIPIDERGPKGSVLSLHAYADFLWLYFMEQEAGPQAIARAWIALESADDGTQGTALFDEAFAFDSHFQDFSLRNLDQRKYKPALGKVYQDLDPKFPELPPFVSGNVVVASPSEPGATPLPRTLSIDHLTTQYYDVSPDAAAKQVTFTPTLQPAEHSHADLVVHSASHGYQRIMLPIGKPTTVCTDGMDEIRLILSYGDYQGMASGTLTTTGGDSCGPSNKITVTSIQPSTVAPHDMPVTLVFRGTGFSLLDPNHIYVVGYGENNGDDQLALGGDESNTVVNDTQVDVTVTMGSNTPPDAYDVTLGSHSPNGVTVGARCDGCLTITGP